jgi:uncharacterized RDD family membrane protein YckC
MDTQPQSPTARPELPADFFEDFDFRPVTEGLGFHHAKKTDEAVQIARAHVMERASAPRSIPRVNHPFTQLQNSVPTAPAQDYVQSDLSLFYARPAAIDLSEEETAPVHTIPSRAVRAVAFVIDLVVVAFMGQATFFAVEVLTGVSLVELAMAGSPEAWASGLVMLLGYFALYFTLLEKFQGATIGKEVLGLRVTTLDGSPVSLMRVAGRTVVTVVGFLSLGCTAWVDLSGKLTGTRVVRT